MQITTVLTNLSFYKLQTKMTSKTISALAATATPLAGTELIPVWTGATKRVTVSDLTAGRFVDVKGMRVIDTLGLINVFGTTASGFRGINYRYTVADANVYGSDAMDINTGEVRHSAGFTGWGGYHTFYANGANQFQVSSAEVKVTTNNVTIGTAAKGINFTANTPAAGMTSQLLNWYEEGTWTPSDGSGAGLSFTITSAAYVRIGRQVTCTAQLTYPATASAANAVISGLPFTSGNYGGGTIKGWFAARTFTITSNGLYGSNGTTSVVIDKSNGTTVAINSDLSGALMYFTIIYFI